MTINLIGDDYPLMPRIITGFYSLDRSLSKDKTYKEIGWPVRTLAEISGPTGIGKTTFCLSLGAILSTKMGGNMAVCPIDNMDRDIAADILSASGFSGDFKICLKDTDEKSIESLLDSVWDEKQSMSVGIWDSVAAISPINEIEGNVGDANMGNRARVAGPAIRKVNHFLKQRKTPFIFMAINQTRTNIGFVGLHTTGGDALKYGPQIKIRMKQVEDFDDGCVLEGKIEKFNFGPDKRTFHVFMLGGVGLHLGLSAVWDCIFLKKATLDNTIKMEGKSYGRANKLIASRDDDDLFKPFIEKLNDDPNIETNGMSPDELLES